MNKDFVAQYSHFENHHWWFIVRKKILLQILQKQLLGSTKKLNILNVGAATGASSIWLGQFGNVVSVEYDSTFFKYLQQQQITAVQASIEALPFTDNSFDIVCAFDVIEHVENDSKAMAELYRVCNTNGIISITVPAFITLWSMHDVANGHKRRYTKNTFTTLLSTLPNYTIQYQTYFNSLLFLPIYIIRQLEKLYRKKDNIVASDFAYYNMHPTLNSLFKKIFSTELFLLKYIKLPIGVSYLAIISKPSFNKT
jgi:ubiquinone/menaquinone biosynthesis C-methylase UbiE